MLEWVTGDVVAETGITLMILPSQMRGNDIRDVDVIDPAEKGCSDDHQYEHEPWEEKQSVFLLVNKQECTALFPL